jgi:hypothetical protein
MQYPGALLDTYRFMRFTKPRSWSNIRQHPLPNLNIPLLCNSFAITPPRTSVFQGTLKRMRTQFVHSRIQAVCHCEFVASIYPRNFLQFICIARNTKGCNHDSPSNTSTDLPWKRWSWSMDQNLKSCLLNPHYLLPSNNIDGIFKALMYRWFTHTVNGIL